MKPLTRRNLTLLLPVRRDLGALRMAATWRWRRVTPTMMSRPNPATLGPTMDRRTFAHALAASAALPTILTRATPTPLQSTGLVIDGLDTSVVNEGFLGLMKAGGVNCVHKSMGDPTSYAATYAFLARHRDVILPVVSVREMRAAKGQGRMSMVFGADSPRRRWTHRGADQLGRAGHVERSTRGVHPYQRGGPGA